MSEKTFAAFHRALQVYENELSSIATLAQEEKEKEVVEKLTLTLNRCRTEKGLGVAITKIIKSLSNNTLQ